MATSLAHATGTPRRPTSPAYTLVVSPSSSRRELEMSGFHSPRNDHTNGEEWQRRPVEVPVWWILMVSATLTVLAVSSVVMIRAYGGSLQTAGRELAARWPPAGITPTPQPQQARTP